MIKTIVSVLILLLLPGLAGAEQVKEQPKQVLFKNVNIFDGKNEKLKMERDVLIEGNLIKHIGKGLKAGNGASVVEGEGRTLMPGLIDMHTHLMFRYGVAVMRSDFDAQAAGAAAMETLQLYMQMGYTTVREHVFHLGRQPGCVGNDEDHAALVIGQVDGRVEAIFQGDPLP